MCASPPTSKEVTACGFAANSRRNSLHSAGRAEPRPYQLRLHFNGFCVKQTVYGLRVYLKTPNAPGQRAFLRCAASFFLEIRQYSCEKMSCATQKSLAADHIMSFQIHPKLMTLPFRGSPGKLRGWQTFRRAYRLSPGHAPRGLVQTTGTAGGGYRVAAGEPYSSQLPTVRGNGSTSRMLEMPVRYMTQRSKPRPNPAWRVEPYLRRAR